MTFKSLSTRVRRWLQLTRDKAFAVWLVLTKKEWFVAATTEEIYHVLGSDVDENSELFWHVAGVVNEVLDEQQEMQEQTKKINNLMRE